jgi:hypothetical protein
MKLGKKGINLNIKKAIYNKPLSKTESISSKVRKETRVSTLPTLT